MKAEFPKVEAAVAILLGLAGGLFALYCSIALVLLPSEKTTDIEVAVLGPWIASIGLVGSVLLFVGSIGVLRRRNWGRMASVAGLLDLALLDAAFLVLGLKQDFWLFTLLLPVLLGPAGLYLVTLLRGPNESSA